MLQGGNNQKPIGHQNGLHEILLNSGLNTCFKGMTIKNQSVIKMVYAAPFFVGTILTLKDLAETFLSKWLAWVLGDRQASLLSVSRLGTGFTAGFQGCDVMFHPIRECDQTESARYSSLCPFLALGPLFSAPPFSWPSKMAMSGLPVGFPKPKGPLPKRATEATGFRCDPQAATRFTDADFSKSESPDGRFPLVLDQTYSNENPAFDVTHFQDLQRIANESFLSGSEPYFQLQENIVSG